MKHSINEWQDMGLKKDVENINRELQKNKSFEKPLIIEIYIAVITLIIDKFFDYSQGSQMLQKIILLILLSIATLIFIYALIVYTKDYFFIRRKIKSSIYSIKPYVDSFDNHICYYALTASNFYENFIEDKIATQKTDMDPQQFAENKHQFYYIEAHYYINKCILELSKMDNTFKDVFTEKSEDVIWDSKIHFSRLQNIVDLLINIRNNLYENSSSVEADQISKNYDKIMLEFIGKINETNKYSTKLAWIDKTILKDE